MRKYRLDVTKQGRPCLSPDGEDDPAAVYVASEVDALLQQIRRIGYGSSVWNDLEELLAPILGDADNG